MSHIPTYVFILFLVLAWMGISRCFPRSIRVERLAILPVLMVVLGVRGFSGLFGLPSVVDLAAAVVGGAVGLAMGWRHVRRWRIRVDRRARSLSIPGDIMMLAIIMGTFAFEFALHYGFEARAGWATASPVEPLAAAIWSWFICMSAGRNLNLAMRFTRARPTPLAET